MYMMCLFVSFFCCCCSCSERTVASVLWVSFQHSFIEIANYTADRSTSTCKLCKTFPSGQAVVLQKWTKPWLILSLPIDKLTNEIPFDISNEPVLFLDNSLVMHSVKISFLLQPDKGLFCLSVEDKIIFNNQIMSWRFLSCDS